MFLQLLNLEHFELNENSRFLVAKYSTL